MEAKVEFRVDDAYLRSGTRVVELDTYRGRSFSPDGTEDRPFLLLLHWAKLAEESSYFHLKAEHLVDPANGQFARFTDDPMKMISTFQRYALTKDDLPGTIREARSHFLAAELQPETTLRLTFIVDTDHEGFIKDAHARRDAEELIRRIECMVVRSPELDPRAAPAPAANRIRSFVIPARIKDARRLPKFEGILAVDFGNHSTTGVVVKETDDEPEIVYFDRINAQSGPIETLVWIKSLDFAADPDRFETASCVIGPAARAAYELVPKNYYGLPISGLKRIVVDSEWQKKTPERIEGREMRLEKDLPAQFFLQELFRRFHQDRHRVPRQIALTYPTTYTPWEIKRLRDALRQGWRRSVFETQRSYDSKQYDKAGLPVLIIDEASAAAFGLIYSEFLSNQSGLGLESLRYGFPDGFRLLILDYGGGTTDAALVRTAVRVEGAGTRIQRVCSVKVEGRTGHRGFGGDNITLAAFRLLKYKLARRLRGGGRIPPLPDSPQEYKPFLDRPGLKDEIDRCVPTLFDKNVVHSQEKAGKSQQLALDLWSWAEDSKIAISSKASRDEQVKTDMAMDYIRRIVKRLAEANDCDIDKVKGDVFAVSLSAAEIDAMILGEVDQSINNVNAMLKSIRDDPAQGVIHALYVVGNASRYPLIRERVRQRLDVRFLNRVFRETPEAELKTIVAKGAALAARLDSLVEGFDLRLESKDCLPFDLLYMDRGQKGVFHPLHHAGISFEELADPKSDRTIPIASLNDDEDTRSKERKIHLYRRWPSDPQSDDPNTVVEQPEIIMVFPFKGHVQGPFRVRYDGEIRKFKIRDEATGDEVDEEPFPNPKANYCAFQSGGQI